MHTNPPIPLYYQVKHTILKNIENGKAYNKFLELVKSQNGNIEYIENVEKFEKAKYIIPVIADKDGNVEQLNAEKIGIISASLGAGRIKKEDSIDRAVGIILNKKIADKIKKGDILAYVHANDEQKGKEVVEQLKNAYKITELEVQKEKIILGVI